MSIAHPRWGRSSWPAWGTSATVHALFLLLIGILQLRLGGHAERLEVAAAGVDPGTKLVLVEPTVEASDPHPVQLGWAAEHAHDAVTPLRIESPLNVLTWGGVAESGPAPGARLAENSSSGGASFFGATADGDRFVYILDVSPSMNHRQGKRLERAVLELLRSVDQLRAEQSFYVMVFGWQTRRMFDDESPSPRMVPATLENKRELQHWLAGLRTIGGTDPRQALDLALRMQPSAIFLLSDGEFNRPKSGGSYTGRGRRVIDVVRRARPHVVPIHTVTFEDPAGGYAMHRIANESNGSNRFVPAPATGRVPGGTARLRYQMSPRFRGVVSRFTFHEETARLVGQRRFQSESDSKRLRPND